MKIKGVSSQNLSKLYFLRWNRNFSKKLTIYAFA